MPATIVIDLTDPDSDYALGDTQLLPRTIAEEDDVLESTVSHHLQTGRFVKAYALLSPAMHPICYHKLYVVAEYDSALHAYLQQ